MYAKSRIMQLLFLGAGLALFTGGCCTIGVGTCTSTDSIHLVASAQLNACGQDNKSHPVAVRFLYLKESRKFNTVPFDDVWADAMGQLGGDLEGGYKEEIVAPGATANVILSRPEGVKAIAMMINFCDEGDLNSRRYVFPLKDKGLTKTVNLQGVSFSVK